MAAFPSLTLNRRLCGSLCHKIYQQATISLFWLIAPPSFFVGTEGHECLQDELHFLIVTFRENGCSQRQSLWALRVLKRVA